MSRSHPFLVQLARVWRLSGRWLPNGWLDALRQLALFAGAYYLYRIVRGIVDGQAGLAFENARNLVDAERALGLFFEPGLQAWAEGQEGLLTFANWMYVDSHFVITTTFLIWLYIARNHALLLRAQHVPGRDGPGARGLHGLPDRAATLHAGVGIQRRSPRSSGDKADQSANVLYNPFPPCRACTWRSH